MKKIGHHPMFPRQHVVLRGVRIAGPTRAEVKREREARILRIAKFPGYRKVQKPCDASPVGKFSDQEGREYERLSNGVVIRADLKRQNRKAFAKFFQ